MSYDAVAKAIPTMSYEEQVSLMELLIESIKQACPNEATRPKRKRILQTLIQKDISTCSEA